MRRDLPHIFVEGKRTTLQYKGNGRGSSRIPQRERGEHAKRLTELLDSLWRQAEQAHGTLALPGRTGTYLEFESDEGFDLYTESLDQRRAKIQLLNVRTMETSPGKSVTKATVHIPADQQGFFLDKVQEYATEETSKGKPRNAKLVNSIENVHLAGVESFWTDDTSLIPGADRVWCEVWLTGDALTVEQAFREKAAAANMAVQEGALRFPDRTVMMVLANRQSLNDIIGSCDDIAEFRRAKETARFFLELEPVDQKDWAEALRDNLAIEPDPRVSVCVLDTGANNGHVLFERLLDGKDMHTAIGEGVHDPRTAGHGTMMCGLAGYGDLQHALESPGPVTIRHCLESVKILPNDGQTDPLQWGLVTAQAISRAEIKAPHRARVVCMAVTCNDNRDQGAPTSWSGELDALAAGVEEESAPKRLIIVSAGNVKEEEEWRVYPDSNKTYSVHDPGQSWNALTVGAYTQKCTLTHPSYRDYSSIAAPGQLSPFSSTSLVWDANKWPAKPDIVMEYEFHRKEGSGERFVPRSFLSRSAPPRRKQHGWPRKSRQSTPTRGPKQYADSWSTRRSGLRR